MDLFQTIPADITVEILNRLDETSLIRCKKSCKTLQGIINKKFNKKLTVWKRNNRRKRSRRKRDLETRLGIMYFNSIFNCMFFGGILLTCAFFYTWYHFEPPSRVKKQPVETTKTYIIDDVPITIHTPLVYTIPDPGVDADFILIDSSQTIKNHFTIKDL